jgi:hypothetical protein
MYQTITIYLKSILSVVCLYGCKLFSFDERARSIKRDFFVYFLYKLDIAFPYYL